MTITLPPLGPFEPLAGGGVGGKRLAISGPWRAAADDSRLVLWSGGRELQVLESPWPLPGWPRLSPQRLSWGPATLDLATGVTTLVALDRWLTPQPGQAVRASACAWADDGALLGLVHHGAAGVHWRLIATADGRVITEVPVQDLPPSAAWIGRAHAVLGARELPSWRRDGSALGPLAAARGRLPALRIEADMAERWLMVLCPGRIELWRSDGTLAQTLEGDWVDATITPSGQWLFAVDASGWLQAGAVGGAMLAALPQAPALVTALAADDAALFIAAGPQRRWHLATIGGLPR